MPSRKGSDRLADRVATFGGSWTFITLFLVALVGWAVLNSVILAGQVAAIDPYPYIFLNLILSMLAALQAPIIMMSQNPQAARDRLVAGLDYEVNLKAELEIMEVHEKLERIRSEHLEELLRTQQEQLRLLTRLAAHDPQSAGAGTENEFASAPVPAGEGAPIETRPPPLKTAA
jgi:uncharacterized membrane protein